MQKTRKKQCTDSEIFKDGNTHRHTHTQTHRHKRLLRTPSGKPGVQNTLAYSSLNNLAIQSYKAPLTTLKYKNLLNHYRLPYKRYF